MDINNISRKFQFNNVNRIHFAALGTVQLIQCDEESGQVDGTEEALEHVKVSQENGVINIRLYTWYDFLFIPHSAVYTIKVKNIEAFSISGSAEMKSDQLYSNPLPLELTISGSARISIKDLKCQSLKASSSGSGRYALNSIQTESIKTSISGSGNYQFGGQVKSLNVSISGSGDVDAIGLSTLNASIHITGSGKVTTQVSDQLDVHISGSGEVSYSGEPTVNQSISGSGKIHRR